MGTVEEYRKRRDERLKARGKKPVEYRMDAPSNNNKNQEESGGGSHGNTRLPFGLCMRYGIAIEPGWGPGDAWAALKGMGISASSAYGKLKAGGDPGTPDSPPAPKVPVKSVKMGSRYGDAEYNKLTGRKRSWVSRGEDPWVLEGERIRDTGEGWRARSRMSERFHTKTDMLHWLKDKGVEEFADPETGEILNPVEMELPKKVFTTGRTGYSAVSIGLRDGRYAVVGTDFEGKKKKVDDFASLAEAKSFCATGGAKEEDIKLSPALKKREAERVSWISSDKKEYFEEGGKKFGDIHIEEAYGGRWYITGEAEDGEKSGKEFSTKAGMMKYLQDQGVEVVREGKEKINPMEYEVPPTKYERGGVSYSDIGMDVDRWGDVHLYGIDLDGRRRDFTYRRTRETLGAFKERIQRDYGISEDQLTISDESRKKFEEITKAEEEKERRRLEFEAKAVELPGTGRKYADLAIEKTPYGEYKITGYGSDGDKRDVSYSGDFYDMERKAEEYGLDINTLLKGDEIQKEYGDYRKKADEFESKAVDFAGDKYADVTVEWDKWDGFTLYGYDQRGRKKAIGSAESYEEYEKLVSQYGHSPDSFPLDDESKKRKERAMRAKEALATGEYYSLGRKDAAYKDVRVEEDPDIDGWKVVGTDIDGNEHVVYQLDTWDEAVSLMSDNGVKDYTMKDKDGQEMSKPKWGMHKIMLMRKPGGGYIVYADSKRYGEHAVMYETPKEEEARKWLRDNGVPGSAVKTRGMNPNDDVPRTHTAKSLENFDTHRMDKGEEYKLLKNMSDSTKVETAEMLTEMFDKGAYCMNREDHFYDIVTGKFKNLLETGTSGGSSYKPGRRETGVKTFGHDYDIKPSDAETYGYWGLDDDYQDMQDSTASGYGKIHFKFKKDTVQDRVTYTFGDTLDAGRPLAGYAGKSPTIEGVSGLDEYGNGEKKLAGLLKTYKQYKNGKISFPEFRDEVNYECEDGYVECQFHGPLTIKDVDTVTFPQSTFERTFSRMSDSERKTVLTRLRDNGVKLQYDDYSGTLQDGYEWLKKKYGEDV